MFQQFFVCLKQSLNDDHHHSTLNLTPAPPLQLMRENNRIFFLVVQTTSFFLSLKFSLFLSLFLSHFLVSVCLSVPERLVHSSVRRKNPNPNTDTLTHWLSLLHMWSALSQQRQNSRHFAASSFFWSQNELVWIILNLNLHLLLFNVITVLFCQQRRKKRLIKFSFSRTGFFYLAFTVINTVQHSTVLILFSILLRTHLFLPNRSLSGTGYNKPAFSVVMSPTVFFFFANLSLLWAT